MIEDERRIALSLKKGLEQEHYVVDVSYNGVEGFDLASSADAYGKRPNQRLAYV